MKRLTTAIIVSALGALAVSVAVATAAPVLVSNGSPPGPFSKNKQNEPGLAVDQANTQFVAAGANDEIDMEDCNAGDPTSCPFTNGVGVSGVYLSSNGGTSFTQPNYQGYSARSCVGPPGYTCNPGPGAIGTLPRYFENGLVSDGDPELAFGPQPDGSGGFSYAAGSRLYYANLASNFSAVRSETAFKGFEAIAVSRLDTQNFGAAMMGVNTAWKAPVIVSKQNSALFSDKEAVWADNAQSSRFFGYAYICNTAFRGQGKGNATPEPILFYRSTDGGETWSNPNQLTAATNNAQSGGRQGCTIRTDSRGVVYVYFEGFDKQANTAAIYQTRSFDGGQKFERPQAVAHLVDCGLPDPASGDITFDGLAGARTDSFASVDIANGAPSGFDGTNEILLTYCDGPTPSVASPGPNERATVKYSTDGGSSFQDGGNAALASERPDFPTIAISPNGTDAYVTYDAFFAPWQPTNTAARPMQAVVRHADVAGAVEPFTDINRGATGDARGSSTNSLVGEFLGDYNYVVATRNVGITVTNDVSLAADCPAVDLFRAGLAPKPQEEVVCPLNFGNTDIVGGSFPDPTP